MPLCQAYTRCIEGVKELAFTLSFLFGCSVIINDNDHNIKITVVIVGMVEKSENAGKGRQDGFGGLPAAVGKSFAEK